MAKAIFVKKARNNIEIANIKKGDSYWWWKFYRGGKQYSKTKPKLSQLTQSSFWSTVFSLKERTDQCPSSDDIEDERDSIVNELELLKEETESAFENIPESLQEGHVLQERIEALCECINELENINISFDNDDKETQTQDYWNEIINHLDDISCG